MQSRKRNYIWITSEDVAAAGPGSAISAMLNGRDIDGTLGFGREFCGFEPWDERVPAHRYYCRVCGAVFASDCPSDVMAEHLRSHQKQNTEGKINNPSRLPDRRQDTVVVGYYRSPDGSLGGEIRIEDTRPKVVVIGRKRSGKDAGIITPNALKKTGARQRRPR